MVIQFCSYVFKHNIDVELILQPFVIACVRAINHYKNGPALRLKSKYQNILSKSLLDFW